MKLDQTPPSVFKNNNTNYSVTFDITDGWLKINPAKLTIKVKGKEETVPYNGQEQTLGQSLQFTVESDLPEGVTVEQKAKVIQEAKGTNVGTYPQNLTADNLVVTGENAGNYTVTFDIVSTGFLKIDPRKVNVTVTGHNDTVTYNGSQQTVTGYDVEFDDELYDESYVKVVRVVPPQTEVTPTASRTDVGTTEMGLKPFGFGYGYISCTPKNTNDNFDVTFRIIDGYITITPATLTIRADNKNKVYGSADPALTATITGLAEGDSVDYTLSRDSGEDVGTYVIHVTVPEQSNRADDFVNENYTINTVDGTFRITPAPLTITTGSANKVYDGTALTNDTVTITGLQRGDSVSITATGSQTAVGSSTNTYNIVWDNAKASNYTVTENLGTLTVTDDDTPTPTPTPTPNPTPNPPNGPTIIPAGPVEPEVEPEPIVPEPTPAVDPQPIEPEPTPAVAPGSWALINLLCAIGSALTSIILLILYFTGKKKDDDDAPEAQPTAAEGGDDEEKDLKRKGLLRILSLIPGIGSVIVFFLTEDMSQPMVMVDKWTILMAVLLVVTIVMAVLSKKTKKDASEEENKTQA